MTALQLAPIVLATLLLVPALLLSRRRPDAHRAAVRSLARPRDLASLTPKGSATSARRLRPGLPTRPGTGETGVALGALEPSGTVLRASWEDVLVAVMAPRSGKTTALAVPAVLDAPGPVVATSNKADLLAATGALRGEVGRVWTFDRSPSPTPPSRGGGTRSRSWSTSRPRSGWPRTSSSPSTTTAAATSGARRPKSSSLRCC
jgi:hypothetical protein